MDNQQLIKMFRYMGGTNDFSRASHMLKREFSVKRYRERVL
jgi:hypothetical protein